MLNKVFFHIGFFLLLAAQPVYSLEWQSIHEKSDNISVYKAEEIIKNKQDSLEDLYLLGLVYLNVYEKEKALSVFLEMLKIDEYSYEAKWGKAEVLRREYKFDQSQDLLREIIDENPGFSPAYVSLAYIKFNLKDYEESARLALEVIKQDQDFVDSNNRARAYLIYGGAKGMIAQNGGPFQKIVHGTQVLPNIKRAQEIKPDAAGVYFGLGVFYLLAPPLAGGNIKKAKEYLEKTIEKDPKFADAYVRLAQMYIFQGDMDKYTEYLKKALELDPQNMLAQEIQAKSN